MRRPMRTPDLPNGQMVQRFDSISSVPDAPYLLRQAGSACRRLPSQTDLERIPDLDPNAQDARRLCRCIFPTSSTATSTCRAYRGQLDGEGSALTNGWLRHGRGTRSAKRDFGELARNDCRLDSGPLYPVALQGREDGLWQRSAAGRSSSVYPLPEQFPCSPSAGGGRWASLRRRSAGSEPKHRRLAHLRRARLCAAVNCLRVCKRRLIVLIGGECPLLQLLHQSAAV
jgi:hypothetical protein